MKTLIAYASKHGTAEECAQMLSAKLSGEVDVINLKKSEPANLSDYDKIIVGGSVYAGQIQSEVKNFCSNNLSTLKSKPLGLYLACMSDDENIVHTTAVNAFSNDLVSHAVVCGALGGAFHMAKMNFFEKAIIKMVTKKAASEGKSSFSGTSDSSTVTDEKISAFAEKMRGDAL